MYLYLNERAGREGWQGGLEQRLVVGVGHHAGRLALVGARHLYRDRWRHLILFVDAGRFVVGELLCLWW